MLFNWIKTIITRGTYNKADMLKKMDLFLLTNRLKEEEYTELVALMG